MGKIMGLSYPKVSSSVEGAVTETLEIGCAESALVGDLVRISETISDMVDVASNNNSKFPVIGEIQRKITTTRCLVILRGITNADLGNGKVYLGSNGKYTIIPPTINYQQILGYSFGNGKIHLDPDQLVKKLI
jgi:hypothetical protein